MVLSVEEKKPLSAKMMRNVAFGGLRALVVAPVPFLLTPLILSKIGSRGYGTWAVFVAMNGLSSLADLGLLGTLSKYVAEYYAHRDIPRLDRLLNTGIVIFTALASVIVALLWIASSKAVGWLFHGSTLSAGELLSLFHCALILIWVNIITILLSSVTSGLQRLDLTHIMTASNIVCAAVGSAALLLKGWGVRGLLYASLGSASLTLLAYCGLVHWLLPQFVFNPLAADAREARKIFKFSLQIYLTQAAAAIHFQAEKLLLALFVGVVPAGWYDIASDVALKVRGVSVLLLGPVMPAASELDARGERDKVIELYYRAHKYMAFVGVPLTLFAVAVSARFVDLWLGSNLRIVAMPLSVLLVVNFLNVTTAPGYLIFAGQGHLRPGVDSALAGIGLNIPLSFALIYFFGFAGAVIGSSVSLVTGAAFFIYLFHRDTRTSFAILLREAYLKPVACSLGLLILLFVARPASNLSWMGLFLQGLIFGLLYATFLLFGSFFDQYDWKKIESVVPIARLARRIVPVPQ